jgi:hypothetical protein
MRLTTLLVVLAACGGGEGGGLGVSRAITADEATPLCMADCQHDIDCGDTNELALCTQSCVEDFVGWARADAVDTFLSCSAMLTCDAVDDTCGANIQPLAIHNEWEAGCRANLAACIDVQLACEVSPDPANTEVGIFRFIAPEIMPDLIACLGVGDCQTQVDCVGMQLELHNINF